MDKKEKPSYYATIPADVRYADIPPNAKLLYGDIKGLCDKEGFCWASNNYFADLYKVTENAITKWARALAKSGFIRVEIIHQKEFHGQNTTQRKIYLTIAPIQKFRSTNPKVQKAPIQKDCYSNTSINITYNKEKHMREYFENKSSDSYETVIDADTNDAVPGKKKPSVVRVKNPILELIQWAEERKGKKFAVPGKQVTYISLMLASGKTNDDIADRWEEMEKEEWYKKNGFDFKGVADNFDRK